MSALSNTPKSSPTSRQADDQHSRFHLHLLNPQHRACPQHLMGTPPSFFPTRPEGQGASLVGGWRMAPVGLRGRANDTPPVTATSTTNLPEEHSCPRIVLNQTPWVAA